MKKMITFFILILIGILFANPIVEGPYITELFFDATGWSLELLNVMFDENLDNCKISSNAGEAHFLPGIPFPSGSYLVVSQDDLQTPLVIEEQGDHVISFYHTNNVSWCNFGTLQTMVLAPLEGQSLVPISFSTNGVMTTDVIFCKDNTPTLGSMNNNEGVQGIFSGYVYDSLLNPVPYVPIEHFPYDFNSISLATNENGYFEKNMYAMNFNCNIHIGTIASIDSFISVEPEIINYYEFVFENYVCSDDIEIELPPSFYNMSNYPNPFNPSTTISFDLSSEIDEDTEINIFNSKGQKINQFSLLNDQSSITWDGTNSIGKSCPSGVYLYKLVSNGKELAANKMLLLK